MTLVTKQLGKSGDVSLRHSENLRSIRWTESWGFSTEMLRTQFLHSVLLCINHNPELLNPRTG
jgi:hypothetical protein